MITLEPIFVTLVGMMKLERDVQSLNALASRVLILEGSVTAVRDTQPANASEPMVLTPVPKLMVVRESQLLNALAGIVLMLLGRVTERRPSQSRNASVPSVVTLLGTEIFASPSQL